MKRNMVIAATIMVVFALPAVAADDPFAGTWKLNVAKSKYSVGTPPKSEMRSYEAQGDGEKLSVSGVAADGSLVTWGYTVRFDGKPYPITGSGPGGADAIAVKRVNPRRVEATMLKGGKAIEAASRRVA